MSALRLLTVLALSGCGLKGHSPALPIVRSETVAVHGYRYCKEAISRVQVYLRQEGVNVAVRPEGEERLTISCYPLGPAAFVVGALTRIDSAYVPVFGITALDEKVLLHEVLHLFRIWHSWWGVMFPLSPFHWFATGASEADLKMLRNEVQL